MAVEGMAVGDLAGQWKQHWRAPRREQAQRVEVVRTVPHTPMQAGHAAMPSFASGRRVHRNRHSAYDLAATDDLATWDDAHDGFVGRAEAVSVGDHQDRSAGDGPGERDVPVTRREHQLIRGGCEIDTAMTGGPGERAY
jgi:hypothetical protein